ncbi:hypothetical protein TNCV_4828811 [Trichonephila clavipes]|nr:hypothetical protein TNCV_4828811 [Trichonephila clavipes]
MYAAHQKNRLSTPALEVKELFEVEVEKLIVQPTLKDEGLSDEFKQIQSTDDVNLSDDNPCREILHCSNRRLIHKRFQVAPEEEIQEIESGDRGGPAIGPAGSIDLPGSVTWSGYAPQSKNNCAGASSGMHHTFWSQWWVLVFLFFPDK